MIVWIIPENPPGWPALSNARASWTRHAVEAPNALASTYRELATVRAACGILPRHGWGDDLFIDEGQRCLKCEKALGLEPSSQNAARLRVRANMRTKRAT